MDAATALKLINDELIRNGVPPLFLLETQREIAFNTLKTYAATVGRPLELAACDVARFQIQSIELERIRRKA